MDAPEDQNFSVFKALFSPWASAYQRAQVSYVGVKTPQGPRLMFGRILLEPTSIGISDTDFRLETEHLIAARFVSNFESADIHGFLDKAKCGEVSTSDPSVSLSLQVDGNFSTQFFPIYPPYLSDGPRLPTFRISGIPINDLAITVPDQRIIDWELKAAETPFDDLNELLNDCKLPTRIQMGDLTAVEIIAKSPVVISDSSTIIGDSAVIECRLAGALDVAKLRLGYRNFQNNSVDRHSIDGSAFDWRPQDDIKIGTYRMLVGNSSLLQAFVSYAGVSHHKWWIMDPKKFLNPRGAIHQVFDKDIELLRRMLLRPDTDKPYVFENAVSTLLYLLGFSVSNYGRIPKLQKGPDIIAVSQTGHVGVVECTIGLLDQNHKLAKLAQRTQLLRERLNNTGYTFLQLQSVIVTPLSRNEVAVNLETAGKHGIAVVCKENIENMLDRIVWPPNADKLFEEAKELIPVAQGN